MNYKGITFDAIEHSNTGIWSRICKHCANTYSSNLSNELDYNGSGTCGVKGCDIDDSTGADIYYIDLSNN